MGKTKSREDYGKMASLVGIFANILLATGKILVGMLFGFVSVMADGFNNLTDCGSSLMSFISFKMSSKPADKEHPYGHERIEYIASMVVAFIILLIAFELVKESIASIISAEMLEFSYVIVVALVVSIVVKCLMFFYNRSVAKKINSDILKATAVDCLSDCISTSVVLVAVILGKIINFNVDGYAGVLVAIFISIAGFNILKEMISKLIGQAPDKEFFDEIKARILAHEEILGVHDLNVYSYGPNKFFASVHIELDAHLDPLVAHELVDDIEREFLTETNIVLTGHYDPIVINDEEVNVMREMVSRMVKEIDESYSMHDFRMVKGPHKTNVIFEVAIPFDAKLKDEEIITKLRESINALDEKYIPVIMVEKQMFI
ncbi:MAG: cation transporter [Clostridiales bacterium]|nr:cation transporter [Clostridiales bacterium]